MNSFFTTFLFDNQKKLIKIDYGKELENRNILDVVKKQYGIANNKIFSFQNMNTECEIPMKYLSQYLLQYKGDSDFIVEIQCTEPEPEPVPIPIQTQSNNNYESGRHSGFSTVEELQSFLQNNCSITMHNYKRKQMLENREKTSIAKSLIKNILDTDPTKTLTARDFIRIDLFLHQIFPKYDIETFYIPHCAGQRTEGKLWDAYNNYRTVLAKAGLIVRRKRTKPNQTLSTVPSGNFISDPLNLDEETLEDIEYFNDLCNQIPEDISTIPWKWVNSFDSRMKLLQTNISILEYMKKFPVLSRADGYKLSILDTEKLYGWKPTLELWTDGIYRKIIETARKNRNDSVKDILSKIDSSNERDQSILALLLLAYLIPNLKRKRSSAGFTRLNKMEVQKSFISFHENSQDANEFERDYAEKCFMEDTGIHPKIVLIGLPIKNTRLLIGDVQYTIKNPIEAVEACISLFLGMNIQYPSDTQLIWYFLQKFIFKITTNYDQKISSVDTFASDLSINV